MFIFFFLEAGDFYSVSLLLPLLLIMDKVHNIPINVANSLTVIPVHRLVIVSAIIYTTNNEKDHAHVLLVVNAFT